MIDSCIEFVMDESKVSDRVFSGRFCLARSKGGLFHGRPDSGHRSDNSSSSNACDVDGKLVSITEAARINKVTRQAIYVAIKQKKLRAVKKVARWSIHVDDLEDYRCHRYSRSKSLYRGKLLFDNARGFYSVGQAAKILNVPTQRVYYATRVGHLMADRKGASWVVHIRDIDKYRREHLSGKTANLRAS